MDKVDKMKHLLCNIICTQEVLEMTFEDGVEQKIDTFKFDITDIEEAINTLDECYHLVEAFLNILKASDKFLELIK